VAQNHEYMHSPYFEYWERWMSMKELTEAQAEGELRGLDLSFSQLLLPSRGVPCRFAGGDGLC
jgi:hypothetical protein